MSRTAGHRLPIGPTLAAAGRLFGRSLTAIFPYLWAAQLLSAGADLLSPGPMSLEWVLLAVVAGLLESVLFGAAIARLDAVSRNAVPAAAAELGRGLRALLAIFIGNIVYNVVGWVGLLAILPGIIFGTTLAFFAFAAVLDRKTLFDALAYSHALAWPEWWRTSAVISVPAIVLLLSAVVAIWPDLTSVLDAYASGRISGLPGGAHPWYTLLWMPLLSALAWCYALAVLYVQYGELKRRAAAY